MDDTTYTNTQCNDGFGAQYQKTIETYIYCMMNNYNFRYRPFRFVEHNYDNDPEYNKILENMINLKNNIENDENNSALEINFLNVWRWFETNIDICCKSEHMAFIKKCFWEHKSKNVFNNQCVNVAVQIRRENSHDNGKAGARATTPNEYYLKIMNIIRNKHNNNKKLQFHIYSQGDINNFKLLKKEDVIFHLDEEISKTFIGLVGADILVTSPSSFSYVAALISDGEIYYKPFWHKPRSNWIISS